MADKKKVHKLGQTVKAEQVTRPDGEQITVTDGLYVLTQTGTYVIDGEEKEVQS